MTEQESDSMTATGSCRYFMELAYNGLPYHGWQSQPNAVSVQSVLEDALSKVLRRPVPIVGAGRTDAGVHALKMTAHFDVDTPLTHPADTVRRVNAITGRDIAVYSLRRVRPDAHARFDATSRTYHYFANTVKSPFLYGQSWQAPASLDFEAMNCAARLLLGRQDFTSFAKLHTDTHTNICTVTEAEWRMLDADAGRWMFVISADRFLRNMVRAVVGTLVEVGRGKLTVEGFADIIAAKNRCSAGTSMPPQALFLTDVGYPDDIYLP